MDRNLALELVRVTEAAALASARFFGKGDAFGADQAAVAAMALAIKGVKIAGHIVIGEQKLSEKSLLCTGDKVGVRGEPEVDILLDPLECIDSLADGQPNSISVIAIGKKGAFNNFSASHMKKIAVGPDAADAIDLNASAFDNLVAIAEAKRKYVEDLTVSILDRKRHRKLVEEVRKAGARIELIKDGDLSAAVAAALPDTGIDVLMGAGGTKQGIISAAALACIGGGFQAQLLPEGESEKADPGENLGRILNSSDMVGGEDIMFAATGVSNSDFLHGVMFKPGGAITNSVVFRRKSGTIRFLKTDHFFDKTPDYT